MADDLTYKQTTDIFEKSGYELFELTSGQQKIAVCPAMGGRVVAATLAGDDGFNPFFVNPTDVKGGPEAEKLIFRGGLGARDWLGPEGCGDMSFYFHKKPLTFENWYVDDRQSLPKMQVKEPTKDNELTAVGEIHINNLRGNQFDILMQQKLKLLTDASEPFGVKPGSEISFVGLERTTTFENIGRSPWSEEYGFAFIWFLAMLRAGDRSYVIAPYKDGPGREVIDYQFNDGRPIPPDRLTVRADEKYVVFKADGNERAKIGFTPQRTLGIVYGMDAGRELLCALKFDVHPNADYLSNLWTEQPVVTGGNVLDAYNNFGNNPVLPGRFYELEAVSPRLELEPGRSFSLTTTTGFFQGRREVLNEIVSITSKIDISGEEF